MEFSRLKGKRRHGLINPIFFFFFRLRIGLSLKDLIFCQRGYGQKGEAESGGEGEPAQEAA